MSLSELHGPHLSRFIMKSEWPLFEFRNDFFYFALNARWWGFRLTPAQPIGQEELSYNSFASFRVGAPDLICSRAYAIPVQYDDQPVNEDPEHWGYNGNLYTEATGPGRTRLYARFNQRWANGVLHAIFDFDELSPSFDLHLRAEGFEHTRRIRFPLYGHYIYPDLTHSSYGAAFYGAPSTCGLMVHGGQEGDITCRAKPSRSIIELNCQPPRPMCARLTVLSALPEIPTTPLQGFPSVVTVNTHRQWDAHPAWEIREMQAQGWTPNRDGAKQRVAGLFVSTPQWGHKSSCDPNTDLFHIAQNVLPRLIETQAFQAVGLSRDGIYEHDLQGPWQALVRQARCGGLVPYMKPGDQELERLHDVTARKRWIESNFNVPEDSRCDVVRLCWESLLRAWSTADTGLEPKYLDPIVASKLPSLPWREAESTLVTYVADLFSFFIDGIRAIAPDTIIDLECGDTRVFRMLMARHDRLGIQYMCYGHYPRVMDYLDLYYNLARHGLGADRVVLETDSYYTHDYHELDLLRTAPPEEIYHEQALDLLRQKHAAMSRIGADAVWAWGLNLNDWPAKFDAICFPERSLSYK